VAPPYDVNDNTAQLAARVILDALGTMIVEGKLGHRGGAAKPRPSTSKPRAARKRKS
jgi:agmatinase